MLCDCDRPKRSDRLLTHRCHIAICRRWSLERFARLYSGVLFQIVIGIYRCVRTMDKAVASFGFGLPGGESCGMLQKYIAMKRAIKRGRRARAGCSAPSGPILTFATALGQVVRKCQNLFGPLETFDSSGFSVFDICDRAIRMAGCKCQKQSTSAIRFAARLAARAVSRARYPARRPAPRSIRRARGHKASTGRHRRG